MSDQPVETTPMEATKVKKEKVDLLPVNVINSDENSALVEFVQGGKLLRKMIPASSINDSQADVNTLAAGIEYGIDWSGLQLPAQEVIIESLIEQLHNNGIWTLNDLLSKPNQAIGSIIGAYAIDYSTLLQYAGSQVKA